MVNVGGLSMKILGISLGTKNGNNDTMCRVALEEGVRYRVYPSI